MATPPATEVPFSLSSPTRRTRTYDRAHLTSRVTLTETQPSGTRHQGHRLRPSQGVGGPRQAAGRSPRPPGRSGLPLRHAKSPRQGTVLDLAESATDGNVRSTDKAAAARSAPGAKQRPVAQHLEYPTLLRPDLLLHRAPVGALVLRATMSAAEPPAPRQDRLPEGRPARRRVDDPPKTLEMVGINSSAGSATKRRLR